jgi:hypothetical protein
VSQSLPPVPAEPTTFKELFAFYHDYVKMMYSAVQTQNALPVELLFELHAALDHVSRHWTYDEPESEAVRRAFGHLKRCCLDIFKLKVKEARAQYDQICAIETGDIDNGRYRPAMLSLFVRIKRRATEARRAEGDNLGPVGAMKAFDLWQDVVLDCMEFESEFYLHTALPWAKRRGWMRSASTFGLGVATSIVAAVICTIWSGWLDGSPLKAKLVEFGFVSVSSAVQTPAPSRSEPPKLK